MQLPMANEENLLVYEWQQHRRKQRDRIVHDQWKAEGKVTPPQYHFCFLCLGTGARPWMPIAYRHLECDHCEGTGDLLVETNRYGWCGTRYLSHCPRAETHGISSWAPVLVKDVCVKQLHKEFIEAQKNIAAARSTNSQFELVFRLLFAKSTSF
jgi:hypothetical protein